MTLLNQEIHQQPDVLERLLNEQTANIETVADAIRRFDPTFVWIAARGTSDNAARYAQYMFGVHLGLAVGLATPSVHTLYGQAPNLGRALVIAISQSGQSQDVRQVVLDAKKQGALTLAMTNDPNSPLATEADHHIELLAGAEKSVAATKTYTAELMVVALLTAKLSQREELFPMVQHVPDYARQTLELSAPIAEWVQRYRYMQRFAVIGRGYNYATAYEISLKVKELCYIPGEEYSEADFRHGPIAVIQPDFPVFMVMPNGAIFEQQYELLQRLHAMHAECLVIANNDACQPYAQYQMPIPADIPEWLSPLVSVMPGQLFAMHLAMVRGHDVDEPRGLTKVTDTR